MSTAKEDKNKKTDVKEKDARFKKIYQQNQKKIYWYIYRKVSRPARAEDLVADVFMKLYENWEDVADRDEKGIMAWIYTVARNASIDYLRKTQTRDTRPIEDEELDPAVKVFDNFVEEAMKDEELANVKDAMGVVSELERDVISMRFEEDLTFSEIAEIIGKKEGACKMMFYRSLKKIRKKLNSIHNDE